MVFFSRLSLATANQIVVVVVAILYSIVHTLPLLVTAYSGPSTERKVSFDLLYILPVLLAL